MSRAEFVAVPAGLMSRLMGFVRRAYLAEARIVEVFGVVGKDRDEALHMLPLPAADETGAEECARELGQVLSTEDDPADEPRYRSFRLDAVSAEGDRLVMLTVNCKRRARSPEDERLPLTGAYEPRDVWIRDLVRRDRERDAHMSRFVGMLMESQQSEREAHAAEVTALNQRAAWAMEQLHMQSKLYLDVKRAEALLASEAQINGAKARAIDETLSLVKEIAPNMVVGIKGWAMAKHATAFAEALPGELRAMLETIDAPQMDKIAEILDGRQRAMFGQAWQAVFMARRAREEREESEKKAEKAKP